MWYLIRTLPVLLLLLFVACGQSAQNKSSWRDHSQQNGSVPPVTSTIENNSPPRSKPNHKDSEGDELPEEVDRPPTNQSRKPQSVVASSRAKAPKGINPDAYGRSRHSGSRSTASEDDAVSAGKHKPSGTQQYNPDLEAALDPNKR
jgi:hypothetical protein